MTGVGSPRGNVGRLYVLQPGARVARHLTPDAVVPPGWHWWKVVSGTLVATNYKLWSRAAGHPFTWVAAAKLLRVDSRTVKG